MKENNISFQNIDNEDNESLKGEIYDHLFSILIGLF